MQAIVIYPKGNLGDTEQRFEIEVNVPDNSRDIDVLERIYRVMNRVDGSAQELPNKLNCRSMSVGDIAFFRGKYWMVKNMGWHELDDHRRDQEYDWEFVHSND